MSNILATINKIIDEPTIINKELLINNILKHPLINNIPKPNNTTKEQSKINNTTKEQSKIKNTRKEQ